jgi:L-fuconolactonase
MPLPIIDTHVHIWDLSRASYPWLQGDTSVLNRNYSLQDLEPERLQTNVIAGILVQAAGNHEDTALMLEVAGKTDWIKGVPLKDPTAVWQWLEGKYLQKKYFCGVRHQIHDEADPEWLLQPAVIESLQLLAACKIPYDLVGILPAHIETAIKVAKKVPGLRMVFDHLNQPPMACKKAFADWSTLMTTAAQHPNFYAKISGLGTASGNFTGWVEDDLVPCIEFVLQQFGAERCFCGGDWPVSLLAGGYKKAWRSYETILPGLLNIQEREKVFYTNALQFYNLEL